MSPDWWRDCRDGIEKCSSPTGDGNQGVYNHSFDLPGLRNVVPRQGTETCNLLRCRVLLRIEKCSSPTGDGNCTPYPLLLKDNFIEKCSSPTGDGNHFPMRIMRVTVIEKCSSPTGDGNRRKRYPPKR